VAADESAVFRAVVDAIVERDGWQFISYSGTVYPLLALSLCDQLPESKMEPRKGD
jgi:hypothetical protein